jgi:hypothetical protein
MPLPSPGPPQRASRGGAPPASHRPLRPLPDRYDIIIIIMNIIIINTLTPTDLRLVGLR